MGQRAFLVAMALLAAQAVPAIAGQIVLNGSLTQSRVSDLTREIQWTTSLSQACDQARREGKMVFWVHMLGDVKGAT